MKVLIHDNVKTPHQPRTEFVSNLVEEQLSRFSETIHQVEVTLTLEGHNSAAVNHCHITASLGSVGVVTADVRHADEHDSIKGALKCLTRGITKRIEKRQRQRQHVDAPAVAEFAWA